MVYQTIAKPSSRSSQTQNKDNCGTAPSISVQAKSHSASPQEQEMPSYTPLAANWASNNNLMRSLSGAQVVQRQEESGEEEMEPIQAKLTIGQVGDKYEQEADETAQRVVDQINAPAPQQSAQGQSLQREEMPEEEDIQMKLMVQRKSDSSGMEATPDLEASIQQAKGGGQPLSDSIKEPMEKAFGADFSGVKVHTDAHSDQLNQSIQAKAFTTGQDVFFRQGAYDPASQGGQELIAHELTHVVQQSGEALQRLPQHQEEEQSRKTDTLRRKTPSDLTVLQRFPTGNPQIDTIILTLIIGVVIGLLLRLRGSAPTKKEAQAIGKQVIQQSDKKLLEEAATTQNPGILAKDNKFVSAIAKETRLDSSEMSTASKLQENTKSEAEIPENVEPEKQIKQALEHLPLEGNQPTSKDVTQLGETSSEVLTPPVSQEKSEILKEEPQLLENSEEESLTKEKELPPTDTPQDTPEKLAQISTAEPEKDAAISESKDTTPAKTTDKKKKKVKHQEPKKKKQFNPKEEILEDPNAIALGNWQSQAVNLNENLDSMVHNLDQAFKDYDLIPFSKKDDKKAELDKLPSSITALQSHVGEIENLWEEVKQWIENLPDDFDMEVYNGIITLESSLGDIYRDAVKNESRLNEEVIDRQGAYHQKMAQEALGYAAAEELKRLRGLWRTPGLATGHFLKHTGDTGFKTEQEYLKRAEELTSSAAGGTIHKKTRADGDDVFFDTSKGQFACKSADGKIRTLFVPGSGITYYNNQ